MERDAEVPRPREGLRSFDVLPAVRKRAELLAQECAVPLEGECAGHQDVVVLQELSEWHEDLPQIRDDPDARRETFRGFRVRDLDEISRVEDDERSLDPVARRDGAGLSRAFRLDLRPDRDEVVEDVHGRGMEGERREARGPRPTVSEPQAAGSTRMAEDRPARDDVLDEHVARLDAQFVFCVLGPRLLLREVFVDELPSVDPEFLHVLLDLRRLQAHPVRDDETRAATDPVRLDPREVAMPADLCVLGAFSVDRDRTVGHDERDLLVGGRILEVLRLAVEWDFLLETLDLLPCRHVPSQAELPPHEVGDQHAQRLAGPARRADRTGVRQVDVRGAVPVPLDLDAGEAFERRDENPFRQDREADPNGPFDRLLLARCRPQGHFLRDEDRQLFPVVGLRQLADPTRDAFDLVVLEEPFDAGGEVVRQRDLHVQFRIETPPPRSPGDRVRRLDLLQEAREVAADLL